MFIFIYLRVTEYIGIMRVWSHTYYKKQKLQTQPFYMKNLSYIDGYVRNYP